MTVAPGFSLWREVVCIARGYHGVDVRATVTWSDERSQLGVSRLEVNQAPGGPPVTGDILRQIPVTPFLRHSFAASVRDGLTPMGASDETPRRAFGLIPTDVALKCRAQGPTDETLVWVALIYRAAAAVCEPPTKAVRETFEVAQSTAGAWVSAARVAGLLGEAEGPGTVKV